MKWIIRNQCGDQDIGTQGQWQSSPIDFNSPLADNDGGVCVAEPSVKSCDKAGLNEADDDIRKGQTKAYDNIDDLIAGLKQSW